MIKEYIVNVIAHLTAHCDIELDAILEFEIIRMLIELGSDYER